MSRARHRRATGAYRISRVRVGVITCAALAVVALAAYGLSAASGSAPAVHLTATGLTSSNGSPLPKPNPAEGHSPRLKQELSGPLSGTGVARPRSSVRISTATGQATATAASTMLKGIDVSSYQDPINWAEVAGAGYKFAAIKATEGYNFYVNSNYATDAPAAIAAGLYVSAYHFARPDKSDGTSQADYAVQNAGNYKVGGQYLPLELDIEYNPVQGGNVCYNLTPSAMVSWIRDFVTAAQTLTGAAPIIYTTRDWWDTCTGNSAAFGGDPLWVAAYSAGTPGTLPAGWSTWAMWQYSSSGTVPGISGAVDLDYFTGGPETEQAPAGTPAWVQIASLNALAGHTVTYSATGLPPGLSISSGGLITGWPYTPGTYQVTVQGADSAGAAAPVSFTWTVTEAADSGPAGHVVLANGGKCLDDTASSTANGNKIQIYTCNGGASQNWTVVQDETLRVFGKCLDVTGGGTANGTAVQLWSCVAGSANQRWQVGTGGELVNAKSGKCLDDPYSRTANGTKLDIWSCNGGSNQRWTLPAAPLASGVAGKCLDDAASSTVNGNKVQIYTCNGGAAQKWTVQPDGTLRVLGKCLDVTGKGTTSGTKVQLWSCVAGDGAQRWQAGAGGELVNPESGLCLGDPGDSTVNGTWLEILTCPSAADPGTSWHVV